MGERYSCIKAKYFHLGKIWRRSNNFFSTKNGTFFSNKESEIEFNFRELFESKVIVRKFHVLSGGETVPYDMIMGQILMKGLQMGVLYSVDVVEWDDVRLLLHKFQNGICTNLNLMYQKYP